MNKGVQAGLPLYELLDVALDLPASVDRVKVPKTSAEPALGPFSHHRTTMIRYLLTV